MIPELFATNDTVLICPLFNSKVPIPSKVTKWCAPCTPMKWRVTLSPWLMTIWLGENVNDLKSQAPALLGSVILKPPPVGIVEFTGGCSAGCNGVFWGQASHFMAACMFVSPSRCTVFIQNSLLVCLIWVNCFYFYSTICWCSIVVLICCFCCYVCSRWIDFLCHCFL